jgi:hypothetical protein
MSWARRVSVPIVLLRSISIAFEVTTFGYRRGNNLSSAGNFIEVPDLIYTIYGVTLHYIWLRFTPHRLAKWPSYWDHCG